MIFSVVVFGDELPGSRCSFVLFCNKVVIMSDLGEDDGTELNPTEDDASEQQDDGIEVQPTQDDGIEQEDDGIQVQPPQDDGIEQQDDGIEVQPQDDDSKHQPAEDDGTDQRPTVELFVKV